MLKTLSILSTSLFLACGTQLESKVVQVDGRDVEVVDTGTGDVTVVFEAGLGRDWTGWDAMASQVAENTRVFAYSRPGYGKSSAASTPRDASTIVEELRGLLADQGVGPPYILVGHSFGGGYMELFAKTHPEEVVAAVIVETRHRDFLTQCEAKKLDTCGIDDAGLSWMPQVQQDEYRAYTRISDEIGDAAFGDYPVRVLTASDVAGSEGRQGLWTSLAKSLAAEAIDGRQVILKGGHGLDTEQADAIAKIIAGFIPRSGE